MPGDLNPLAERISFLLEDAGSITWDLFPKSEHGYPDATPPEWSALLQRVQTLVTASYREDSSQVRLMRRGVGLGESVEGNSKSLFEEAKRDVLACLDFCLAATDSDIFGELVGSGASSSAQFSSTKIFIVHGHDYAAKDELETFLKELQLEPIVLHRQPDQGQTIIEKIERHSDVGFAVILINPDDATAPSPTGQSERRARQNVLFEWGYFVGRLSRQRVCCLYQEGTTLPSDLGGMLYKPYHRSINEVKIDLVKELRAAGYEIRW